MLNHLATIRRWRRSAFTLFLLVLGLVEVGLPCGRAEMRYSGGYIRTRRSSNDGGMKQLTPKTPPTPKTPSSYSPDNDFAPAPLASEGEPERPLALPPRSLTADLSASSLPWNRVGFADYDDRVQTPRDVAPATPEKYALEVTTVRPQPRSAGIESANLIAHLPEHALLWVEGTITRLTGRTRRFQSPPLLPERKYSYRVRVVWIEDGHWVSQTRTVPVEAGSVEAVYLQRRPR
jgi:uncharacterized protein (TIGR03000 family)